MGTFPWYNLWVTIYLSHAPLLFLTERTIPRSIQAAGQTRLSTILNAFKISRSYSIQSYLLVSLQMLSFRTVVLLMHFNTHLCLFVTAAVYVVGTAANSNTNEKGIGHHLVKSLEGLLDRHDTLGQFDKTTNIFFKKVTNK